MPVEYGDGGLLVPRYRSYAVAPLEADQLSVGLSGTPVAPLAGEGFPGEGLGSPHVVHVVNDQTAELVEP